jgi:hypothetical protein
MRRSFHVRINNRTLESHDTFEGAKEWCLAWYRAARQWPGRAKDGDMVEIVRMSVTVWGPFVVGGSHVPTGVSP